MRKMVKILLCLAALLSVTGCGKETAAGKVPGSQPAGVKDVLEQGMMETDSVNNDRETLGGDMSKAAQHQDMANNGAYNAVGQIDAGKADIDLTVLPGTMVYAEVFNMTESPDDFIGKTVKMSGAFSSFHDAETDKYYFACFVQDAAACCAQGIEFELAGTYKYPDDYPAEGEDICVMGVFDTYQEGEYTYFTLRNAKFL